MASRNGFTLIELLVVVAIIMVLAALLAPSLRSARESAVGVVCISNLGQITTALHGYLPDNADLTPPYQEHYSVRRSERLEDGTSYRNVRRMWIHTEWFKSGPFKGGVKDGDGFLAEYLGYGSFNGVRYGPGVLEYERALGGNLDATIWRFDSGQGQRGRKFHEIDRPSKFIFFADMLGYSSAALAIHHEPAFSHPEDFASSAPPPRHLGSFNGAFMDGHVAACDLAKYWTPDYFIRDR